MAPECSPLNPIGQAVYTQTTELHSKDVAFLEDGREREENKLIICMTCFGIAIKINYIMKIPMKTKVTVTLVSPRFSQDN